MPNVKNHATTGSCSCNLVSSSVPLSLSCNIGRKGRGTLFVRMPALRDLESGGPELEYITSRQEKTKRCTKLDKNVVQRYVKARQRRNKTATENCLLLRGLFIRNCFLFRWPFLHYICNLSSFNTVVIGQLQWHHILCFAAAISYRKWSNGLQGLLFYFRSPKGGV